VSVSFIEAHLGPVDCSALLNERSAPEATLQSSPLTATSRLVMRAR
jgi:hypothetical protein